MIKDLNYIGVLYIGLIVNKNSYNILEFNCRFSDPEAQVLLTLLDSDLYNICNNCILGLDSDVKWKNGYASNVVSSHNNYPYSSIGDIEVNIKDKLDDNIELYWSGSGRFLSITSYNEKSLYLSIQNIYNNIHKIEYDNKYFRSDIGIDYCIKSNKIIDRKMNIAILGTTNGTSSQLLIDKIKSKELNAEIKIIISNKRYSGILERAKDNNIPFLYLPFKKHTKEDYDKMIVNILKLYDVDIIFLIGYMRIVTSELINHYRNRLFNIHPSLLPKYSGGMDLNVHREVINNNELYSGYTLHKVTEIVDGGEIMLQEQVKLDNDDEYTLKDKVQELEMKCIVNCVKLCINGQYNIWGSYKDSGVDVEKGNKFVRKIKELNTTSNIGGFCSILDMNNHFYGISTDGVGTKLELAKKYDKYDGIGIDLVAMSVNDLIANGIRPKYFLDYLAIEKLDIEMNYKIIKSIVKGCEISGCELVGGETAEMTSVYYSGGFDLAGFALGESINNVIIPYNINKGNIILGIKSSGVHSNGYTLINKLLKYNHYNINKLLEPTKIYTEVIEILERYPTFVNGISHITGGGFKDNINRILHGNLQYKLTKDWEFPDVFKWIQKYSMMSKNEMMNTFNCGYGMILIVDGEHDDYDILVNRYKLDYLGYIY